MILIEEQCPYCFNNFCQPIETIYKIEQKPNLIYIFGIFFKCYHCKFPIVLTAESELNLIEIHNEKDESKIHDLNINSLKSSIEFQFQIPEHIPANIKSIVYDCNILIYSKRPKYQNKPDIEIFESAIILCRKIIELTLDDLFPELSNLKLFKRIEILRQNQILPPVILEAAHLIRVKGNLFAHNNIQANFNEADACFVFTCALLEYLYTIPQKLNIIFGYFESSGK